MFDEPLHAMEKCVDVLYYISIFEDDILLGEHAEQFLANDEWLKVRFNFQEIFVLRLETFLMPVQLEKQQQILPFQERNIDILKSNTLVQQVILFRMGQRSTS